MLACAKCWRTETLHVKQRKLHLAVGPYLTEMQLYDSRPCLLRYLSCIITLLTLE